MPPHRVRINVVSGGVRHVAPGIVRHNRDVIAYLLIVRIACLRIKRIAHRDVRRPCHTAIGAP
jgi:hypothetical protein